MEALQEVGPPSEHNEIALEIAPVCVRPRVHHPVLAPALITVVDVQ